MSALNMTMAMSNNIHTGDYDPPELDPARSGYEWLIVRRWGERGQYLEISDAGAIAAQGSGPGDEAVPPLPGRAPENLTANNSMLGLMVRSHGDTGAVFLLVRRNVDHQPLGGAFFPVDGYAELMRDGPGWRLRASGRHAHTANREDIPNPENEGHAMSWHFDAVSVYWQHQQT